MINSFFPGRWTKIEEPCVPQIYVQHLIAKIAESTESARFPYSVVFLRHRALPYRMQTQKISYKIFDVQALQTALEEQEEMPLQPNAAFHFLTPVPDEKTNGQLTMREKIMKAKKAGGSGFTSRTEVPTSRISLIVSPGEGRATREVELIYWPGLYKTSGCCKFQLRFFIQKCELH